MLNLQFYHYDLKLSQAFTIASSSRTLTQAIFVEIQYDGIIGYGQASFPPYIKERREDNLQFLSTVDLSRFTNFSIGEVQQYVDELSPVHAPAKAAIDMALHDLAGKIQGIPVYELLSLKMDKPIYSSFTVGMGDDSFIIRQLGLAGGYKTLKIKLGEDITYNKKVVELIRKYSSQPICVDFNQGLKDKETALLMIEWLAGKNIYFVEQPLPVEMGKEYIWLKGKSPLPLFGDESIQNHQDIIDKQEQFHGVNIKLMKSGGIRKAAQMILLAKELGLKTMIGCMTESVCAVTAAAHLAPLVDYMDLDGNLLINNDPFKGVTINNGEVILPAKPGLGLEKKMPPPEGF